MEDRDILAEVADNGRGFDVNPAALGLDLKSKCERMTIVGKFMASVSKPACRPVIRFRVPVGKAFL